jgi:hypothetical protein
LNRRRFLKYAGVSAATVAGASAVGLDYALKPKQTLPTVQTTTHSVDLTPPIIGDFQWLQDASKMHDGTIKFSVSDTSGVASARLNLVPVFPSEIPAAAIPAENWIDFPSPIPNATLPSRSAEFSQVVADLKGGKAYTTNIIAKDTAGNQAIQSYDVPYVREFENIAGLDDIVVGATYHPWWSRDSWRQVGGAGETTPNGRPLLGLYNSSDPVVVSKHVDWATGYGIDYFFCSYPFADPMQILANPLAKDSKVAILYEIGALSNNRNQDIPQIDLNSPNVYSTFQAHFDHMAVNYFTHPSFLRIGGRPVVYLFASGSLRADITKPFAQLRRHMSDMGVELYIIGDEMGAWGGKISLSRLKAYDAITTYGFPPVWRENESLIASDDVFREYDRWRSSAHTVGIEIVPSVYPGFDNAYLAAHLPGYGAPHWHVPRSVEFFKSNLEIALEFLDKSRLLMIVSWDEWGENSFVEPTVEDGFKYLQTIRDTLAGH